MRRSPAHGAQIHIDGRSAIVNGPTMLNGARVIASDLRASASLVLAGLIANGETVIDRVYHIDRGYEKIERSCAPLGLRLNESQRLCSLAVRDGLSFKKEQNVRRELLVL